MCQGLLRCHSVIPNCVFPTMLHQVEGDQPLHSFLFLCYFLFYFIFSASFIGEAPIRTNIVRPLAERLTTGPHRLTCYYTTSWLVFIYKAARISCVQYSTLGIERSINEAKQTHVLPARRTPIFYLYNLHRREIHILVCDKQRMSRTIFALRENLGKST